MRLRPLFFLLLLVIALAGVRVGEAQSAVRTDAWLLHHGSDARHSSRGPRVAKVQYLIRDPRPAQNVFRKVRGTLKHDTYTSGIYGAATAKAVRSYKYRLGYPGRNQCPRSKPRVTYRDGRAGPWFVALLRGRVHRPLCWVALASSRLKAVESGAKPGALKLRTWELSQLGVNEPYGPNRGPVVNVWERHFGLYAQPWCAIFINYGLYTTRQPLIGGNNRFYVPEIARWALRNNYFHAKPKVGALVIYLSDNYVLDSYHIGYVVKITAAGWVSVEGNSSDRVAERFHPWNERLRAYIYLPWLT